MLILGDLYFIVGDGEKIKTKSFAREWQENRDKDSA